MHSELERQPMKSRGIASNSSHNNGEGEEEVVTTQSEGYALGGIIWVKLRGKSWWPAQVVDEKAVSGRLKPRNKSEGKILVRQYGCYTYMYVDPLKSRSEFNIVLNQNNGCRRAIFQKALEQARGSTKQTEVRNELKRSCSSDEDGNDKTPEKNKHKMCPSTNEPSARKVRVMQKLGLVAPPGSPFSVNR